MDLMDHRSRNRSKLRFGWLGVVVPPFLMFLKRVASLQRGLSEAERHVRGRERALGATNRGFEALARDRQQEAEARAREVGPQRVLRCVLGRESYRGIWRRMGISEKGERN